MANEAVINTELEPAVSYTVANATGIEKGALLKLTDPKTAIISSAQYDPIAGIAASEKIASDGNTNLGVYKRGRFKMTASGSIGIGDPVCSYADSNYPNVVGTAKGKVAASGASILGVSEEAATDGQTLFIFLNTGCGAYAGA